MPNDKDRLDWLDNGGRIAKFTDGWTAWIGKSREIVAETVREAIDGAIRQENPEAPEAPEASEDGERCSGAVTCGCGKPGTDEPHACPYAEEIHRDHAPVCNCCDECVKHCCEEI